MSPAAAAAAAPAAPRNDAEDGSSNRFTRTLADAVAGFREAVSPSDCARVALEQALSALGARAGALALLTSEDGDLELAGTVGFSEIALPEKTFPLAAPFPLAETVRTHTPLFLSSPEAWKNRYGSSPAAATTTAAGTAATAATDTPDNLQGHGFAAWAALPLRVSQGGVLGGFCVAFAEPRDFASAERAFLEALADLSAQACERALAQESAEAAGSGLAHLLQAGEALGAAFTDPEGAREALARAAVPWLADIASVHAPNPVTGEWERSVICCGDQAHEALLREAMARYPLGPPLRSYPLVEAVVHTGATHFVTQVTDTFLSRMGLDPVFENALRTLGLRSLLLIPLVARGRTVGVLSLMTHDAGSGRCLGEAERVLAEELARRAAVSMDNALLYAEALQVSTEAREALDGAKGALAALSAQKRDTDRFVTLVEHSSDFICVTDRSGRALIYVNRAGRAAFGLKPLGEDADGDTAASSSGRDAASLGELLIEDDIPLLDAVMLPALAAEGKWRGELRFRRGDDAGERETEDPPPPIFTDCVAFMALESDRAGAPLYMSIVARDITALRESEIRRQEAEEERERARRERELAALQQRRFLKDVLLSVTEGRLNLCDTPSELPPRLPPPPSLPQRPLRLSPPKLSELRARCALAVTECGLAEARGIDLVMAAGEAAMNAVVHGGGGLARVGADKERGVIQVWVEDTGKGIDLGTLPLATLQRGFTTAGSLGHGFHIMLQTADRVYLLTRPVGTTVVIEQDRDIPVDAEWPDGW